MKLFHIHSVEKRIVAIFNGSKIYFDWRRNCIDIHFVFKVA